MIRLQPADSAAAWTGSAPVPPATAPGKIRFLNSSRQSSPPPRVRGGGIPRATCERISCLPSERPFRLSSRAERGICSCLVTQKLQIPRRYAPRDDKSRESNQSPTARNKRLSTQPAVVHPRVVIHSHVPVHLVLGKNAFQFLNSRLVIRVSRQRHIRRGQQPSLESRVVEFLGIIEHLLFVRRRREELANGQPGTLMAYFVVINSPPLQQRFVGAMKGRRFMASLVPHHHRPTTRLQDANKLPPRFLAIKPVCRLRGGDEIHGSFRQRGRFRATTDAYEFRVAGQNFIPCPAHVFIRLNSKYPVAVLQEKPRQHSSSGADISNHGVRREMTFLLQQLDDGVRVSRPVANVIVDAGGKTLGGIAGHDSILNTYHSESSEQSGFRACRQISRWSLVHHINPSRRSGLNIILLKRFFDPPPQLTADGILPTRTRLDQHQVFRLAIAYPIDSGHLDVTNYFVCVCGIMTQVLTDLLQQEDNTITRFAVRDGNLHRDLGPVPRHVGDDRDLTVGHHVHRAIVIAQDRTAQTHALDNAFHPRNAHCIANVELILEQNKKSVNHIFDQR